MEEKIIRFLLVNRVSKSKNIEEKNDEPLQKKEDYRMYMLGKLLTSKRRISNEEEVITVKKERIDSFFAENIIDYIKLNKRERRENED